MSYRKAPTARATSPLDTEDGRRYVIHPARARIVYSATDTGGTTHAAISVPGDDDHWIVTRRDGTPIALLTYWGSDYTIQRLQERSGNDGEWRARALMHSSDPDWRTLVGAL